MMSLENAFIEQLAQYIEINYKEYLPVTDENILYEKYAPFVDIPEILFMNPCADFSNRNLPERSSSPKFRKRYARLHLWQNDILQISEKLIIRQKQFQKFVKHTENGSDRYMRNILK